MGPTGTRATDRRANRGEFGDALMNLTAERRATHGCPSASDL